MKINTNNILKLDCLIRMPRNTKRRARVYKKQRGGGKFDQLPLATITALTSRPEYATLMTDPTTAPLLQSIPGLKKNAALMHVMNSKLTDKITAELKAEWQFQLLMGHGEILPGTAEIPPDTYVIFNSPAGCISIALDGLPNPAFVGTNDTFYTEMAKDIALKQRSFDTTDTDIRSILMTDSCYPESFFKEPKNSFTRKTKFSKLMKNDPKLGTLTIYGPGEQVYDMSITFKNNTYQTLYLGLFDLPISPAYHEEVVSTIRKLKEEQAFAAKQLSTQSESTMRRIVSTAGETTSKYDKVLFKRPPNLKPDYVSTVKSLKEIFAELPPLPAGKKRLLFVGSCRGICPKITNKAEMNITRGLRRGSLNSTNMAAAVEALRVERERIEAATRGHTLGGLASAAPVPAVNTNVTVPSIKALLYEQNSKATPRPRLMNIAKTLRKVQAEKKNLFNTARKEFMAEKASAAAGGP